MIYIEENSFERQIDLISALASQAPFEYCKGVLRAGIEFNPDIGFYTFSITWRQRITAKCGT
jgi:hypothetical protein